MSLITQAIQDIPEVIIVTDLPKLALVDRISALLINNNLHPTIFSPAEFSSGWQKLLEDDKFVYKIIIVTGFGHGLDAAIGEYGFEPLVETPQISPDWQTFLANLSESQLPATFILGQTKFWPNKPAHHFLRASLAQNYQSELIMATIWDWENIQVFVARDCLSQTLDQVLVEGEMESPLLLSAMCAHERVLLDPQKNWHLQTQEEFFEAIAQQLLKPHRPSKILVQGKAILSQTILSQMADLIEKYFAYSPTLLPLASEPEIEDFSVEIVCQVESDVLKHLDAQIRSLPHSLMRLEEFSRKAQSFGQSALFSPRAFMAGAAVEKNQITSSRDTTDSIFNSSPTTIDSLLKSTQKKATHGQLKPLKSAELVGVAQLELTAQPAAREIAENLSIQQSNLNEKPLIGIAELEGELQKIFSKQREGDLKTRLTDKAKNTQKIISKTKHHQAVFYLGLTLSILGVLTIFLWGFFKLSYFIAIQDWKKELQTYSKLATGDSLTTIGEAGSSEFWLSPLKFQLGLYQSILDDELLADATAIVEIKSLLREYVGQEIGLAQDIGNLTKNTLDQSISNEAPEISKLTLELESHQKTTQALEEKLAKIDSSKLSLNQSEQLTDLKNQSLKTLESIAVGQEFLKVFSSTLGGEGKRVYALVVQDQQELRPTGGFIQAVGLLRFDKNSLISADFKNVYEIDNQLATKISPPDEVLKYLGETNWYLRDANWSPDFPTSAQQINFFLKESLDQPVDGVIGITLEVVKNWLALTGPIEISELNEQVSDKNFYDRVEFHTTTKAVEVNGKKIDYLNLVMTKLVPKIVQLDSLKLVKFLNTSGQLLQSHDIQVAQFGQEASFWTNRGWSGALISPNCPVKFANNDCFVDSLYQVEANVGINKVNPFVQRKVVDHIDISKTAINHRRLITFKNQSKLDGWPQGGYRAFVKFYLSKAATDVEISLNGIKLSPDQAATYFEQDKLVIGSLIQVPKQGTVGLEIKYRQQIQPESGFSYFFFNQKQAGVEDSQEVILSYQPGLRVLQVTPQAELSNQLLNFRFVGKTHSFVGVTLE